MIEAELKARVGDVETVRTALASRADGERATYTDTYYDRPDESLDATGYEVRLRTVETAASVRHVLTYKEPSVDPSGSKPEHETTIDDPAAIDALLRGLGLVELVALTKQCENYRFESGDRSMLATLVTVPEIDGTFIEVETMTEGSDLHAALDAVRAVLEGLGVANDLEDSTYTGAVREARKMERR